MSDGIGTNVICQIGLIVRDVEKVSKAYAEVFKLPVPGIITTDPVEKAHTKYRGQPSDARAKLAFFNFGSLSIELIQPLGGKSTWQEFLDAHGEGVHHIAFNVKGTDQVVACLEGQGMKMVQRGDYTGGCYTYIESQDKLKVILELLESIPA